jgi:hypothetical protein
MEPAANHLHGAPRARLRQPGSDRKRRTRRSRRTGRHLENHRPRWHGLRPSGGLVNGGPRKNRAQIDLVVMATHDTLWSDGRLARLTMTHVGTDRPSCDGTHHSSRSFIVTGSSNTHVRTAAGVPSTPGFRVLGWRRPRLSDGCPRGDSRPRLSGGAKLRSLPPACARKLYPVAQRRQILAHNVSCGRGAVGKNGVRFSGRHLFRNRLSCGLGFHYHFLSGLLSPDTETHSRNDPHSSRAATADTSPHRKLWDRQSGRNGVRFSGRHLFCNRPFCARAFTCLWIAEFSERTSESHAISTPSIVSACKRFGSSMLILSDRKGSIRNGSNSAQFSRSCPWRER